MQGFIIEKLDKSKHSRSKFNCGVEVLNIYLKLRANQEQKKNLNVNYVAVNEHDVQLPKDIAGFYTLSNSSISLSRFDSKYQKKIPPTYQVPTVCIGRLAVDINYQNIGLGAALLKDALVRISKISEVSGVKGVEVIAKNSIAKQFYKKLGFLELRDSNDLFYLPIQTLKAFTEAAQVEYSDSI